MAIRPLPLSPAESSIDTLVGGSAEKVGKTPTTKTNSNNNPKGLRFWLVYAALAAVSLLAALEASIVTTPLPTIAYDLKGESDYVWVLTAYLVSCGLMPLWAQASDLFGRRAAMMASVGLLMVGSAISGAAPSMPVLIAGRAVQGIGGAGILSLVEIVVSDICTLRERGKYQGIIAGVWAAGTVMGPLIGGALADGGQWRWVFYLNLPIGAVALVMIAFFLTGLNKPSDVTLASGLKRIDWLGVVTFLGSVVSIEIALAWGGTTYTWTSARVLVPLLVGVAGLVFFLFVVERYAELPIVPIRLFRNRTAVGALLATFLHAVAVFGAFLFLPLMFMAVYDASPIRSGVLTLPSGCLTAPFAGLAGFVIAKTGKYKGINAVGFALLALGIGLFQLLSVPGTSRASTSWQAGLQVPFAMGAGILFVATLPPLQAALDDPKDMAAGIGQYAFARQFGSILALSAPVAVFNSRVDTLAKGLVAVGEIPEPVRRLLARGGAYSIASTKIVPRLATAFPNYPGITTIVKQLYVDAVRSALWLLFACAVLGGVVVVLVYKSLELSAELRGDFGFKEEEVSSSRDASDSEKVADLA